MQSKLSRRKFLKHSAVGAAALTAASVAQKALAGPFIHTGKFPKKVIVLGMDGMDPNLIRRWAAEGKLPTFKRLMERGAFSNIGTTNPPQSPVAWASFITGTNPGGNGIFDFVHRDPKNLTPYLSTSRSFEGSHHLDLGSLRIPLDSGRVELMRKGKAFWSILEDHGIPTTVCQIPSNFPIEVSATKAISGMGTPDLLGTYGTFTYYTEGEVNGETDFAGGKIVRIRLRDHRAKLSLTGPSNAFRTDGKAVTADISVVRDPGQPFVRIQLQGNDFILGEGEWSGWKPVSFEYAPVIASSAGMVRFYAKRVHPELELYVSPINVDPLNPSLPISSPPEYSAELARAVGRFHTQGFPADTKALSHNVLSNDEFMHQAKLVLDESMSLFDYQFRRFDEGMMFFYFSSVDQGTHMMWRTMDPQHPLYEPNAPKEIKDAVPYLYQRMDEVLRSAIPDNSSDTALIALSDHGFAPFTREFNVSTWLAQNGYIVFDEGLKQEGGNFFNGVDWKKTKAYSLGLNGIYINRNGRETNGWVGLEEAAAIKAEIMQKLRKVNDPKTGLPVLADVHDTQKIYSGDFTELAPDIIMGYNRGYRVSDEAVLGQFPKDVVTDRTDKWSADHCVEAAIVPGMLITNRELSGPVNLWDMAPSILGLFGISAPPQMNGKPVLT